MRHRAKSPLPCTFLRQQNITIVKKPLLVIILLLSTLLGCKKADGPVTSGTATIRSTLYGTGPYYSKGFSFSAGKEVSTISDPGPDMTVNVSKNTDGSININMISFETPNYYNSFSLIGEFESVTTAVQAFTNLKTVGDVNWTASAIPLKINQIWLYRNDSGKFVKLRIISLVEITIQNQLSVECTFEWVYQPDGSVTFPLK
jgi:hypothetical protein